MTAHRFEKSIFSFLIISIFLIQTSCTKKANQAYGLDPKETLRWNISTEPPSLDWHKGADTTSSRIVDTMMEGMTRFSFDNNKIETVPALSASWESSKDQTKWTFVLRSDVKWTDGVPLTAQHFVDAWKRLLSAATAAEYSNFLFCVKNAEKYFKGEIKDFSEVGVKVGEKGELVVELNQPMAFFPSLMAHHSTYPMRIDIVEKFGEKWTEPANIVTLGAYFLKVWDHDKAVVLERSESYYGQKPKVKYILGRAIESQSTAFDMFRKGELDALDEIPSIEANSVLKMPEYHAIPSVSVYFYGFNVKKAPLDNVKVRRAISMAINRDEVNQILSNQKIPAINVVPPGLVGHDPNLGLKFDPAAASKMLDEAGFKDRTKFPRLQMGFNTSENHQRIAENIQAQLKRNLGIDMDIHNEEWKTYQNSLQNKNYQIYRLGWVADYPDADTFINIWVTNGGNNHTNWSNKKFDELVKQGASESDPVKRAAIYAQAQTILHVDEVPMLPIYYYRDQYLVTKRIKNYPMNAMNKFYTRDMEIVPE